MLNDMKSRLQSGKLIKSILVIFVLLFVFGLFSRVNAQSSHEVLVNEVEYDSIQSGIDSDYEWLELYNISENDINLENWKICDNSGCDILSSIVLPSKKFIVIAANQDKFEENYQELPDIFLELSDGKIGSNGLSNSGDSLILKDKNNEIQDQISWGNDTSILNPSIKDIPSNSGFSLERCPKGKDSDTSKDFIQQEFPTPGMGLPEKVQLLSPLEITTNSLVLNWTQSQEIDFYSYMILQSETQEELGDEIFEITDISEMYYLVEDLQMGKTYYFTILVFDNNDFFSPSNQVSAITKIYYSNQIIINEILPRPDSGSDFEFVELFNRSNQIVNLSGWLLDDSENGSKPYIIPEGIIIKPKSFLVFYKSQNKITLNDDQDQARLFWPNGILVSKSTKYKSAQKGFSWAKNSRGNWVWTTKPTPKTKNIIKKPIIGPGAELKVGNILKIKKFPKGTPVKTSGTIIAQPGIFSKYYFYIQDDSGGIQIYFSKGEFGNLKLGNKIQVKGDLSESQGEKRIKLASKSDIIVLGQDQSPPPQKIKTGQVANFQGMLIQVSGNVVESRGSTFYIDDGSGKIRIYVSRNTNIDKPTLKKGYKVLITGIVSQTSAGFRILPRFQKDFVLLTKIVDSSLLSSESSIFNDILGIKDANAASGKIELGKDYRPQAKGEYSWLGWILVIFGIVLLLGLFGISYWSKNGKNNYKIS